MPTYPHGGSGGGRNKVKAVRFPDPLAPVRFYRRDRDTPMDRILQAITCGIMVDFVALFLGM